MIGGISSYQLPQAIRSAYGRGLACVTGTSSLATRMCIVKLGSCSLWKEYLDMEKECDVYGEGKLIKRIMLLMMLVSIWGSSADFSEYCQLVLNYKVKVNRRITKKLMMLFDSNYVMTHIRNALSNHKRMKIDENLLVLCMTLWYVVLFLSSAAFSLHQKHYSNHTKQYNHYQDSYSYAYSNFHTSL